MLTGVNHGFYDYPEHPAPAGLESIHFQDLLDEALYESDEFRMYGYKIKRCAKLRSHDWTACPFAHRGERARRRDPRKYHYAAIPCPSYKNGECRKGEACELAHGVFEFWLHPAKYRTRSCNAGVYCNRKVCFFAHTDDELRGEAKYKWQYVYHPVQPYVGVGLGNVTNGGLGGLFALRPVPAIHARAINGNNPEVMKSLAMLNIKNGQYEMPKAVGWPVMDSDCPDVNWVTELVEELEI